MSHLTQIFSWREINSSHRLMTALILALGVWSFFFGELVPEGGGLGWDGVAYADLTRELGTIIGEGRLSNYYAHRILPSAIVRGMLLAVGADFSNLNIIRGFECYNLVLLVGASLIWKRIANRFAISLGGRWLGFCGLFLSYMASKQTFYYPVLTDTSALLAGLLALLGYVERRPLLLLGTAVVGALAWPVVSACGAVLLVFLPMDLSPEAIAPRRQIGAFASHQVFRWVWVGWMGLLIYLVAFVVGLGDCYMIKKGSRFTGLASLIACGIALTMLAGSTTFVQEVIAKLRRTGWVHFLLALAALLIPGLITRLIANPALPNANTLDSLIELMVRPESGKFLLPLVTLTAFWGPVVLVMLLNWGRFCVVARTLGPGFMAVVGLNLVLGLPNEPRFVTFGWPFVVLGTVLAMEGRASSPAFKYAFAILTCGFSQFWMKFNFAPWTGGIYDNLLVLPKQVFFMHYGLWMSWWAYALQLGAIALSGLWLWTTMRQSATRPDCDQPRSD